MEGYNPNGPFCQCEHSSSYHTDTNDWGQWDVCNDCNKPIEDSFEYYNHHDGEDHVFEY